MKFISSEAKLIEENSPYKLVERIGRMCYKSEDKITEDSCYNFVKNLADRKHYAMLEHANLHFKVLANDILPVEFANIPFAVVDVFNSGFDLQEYIVTVSMSHMYQYAPQLTGVYKEDSTSELFFYMWKEFSNDNAETPECYEHCPWTVKYIEESDIEDLTDNQAIIDRHIFKSIKFTCDRGVSHELVRHRCAVAQESTRYCNYTKDKFGNEIQFIWPAGYEDWPNNEKTCLVDTCVYAEHTYNTMIIDFNMKPEQARAVLPNALKTEVVLTMSLKRWKHFFDIRLFDKTGKAHPDMKEVAGKAYEILKPYLEK